MGKLDCDDITLMILSLFDVYYKFSCEVKRVIEYGTMSSINVLTVSEY